MLRTGIQAVLCICLVAPCTGLGATSDKGERIQAFCIDFNWGPARPHIPLTTEYLDYLCATIEDALHKTDIDGFMLDWMYSLYYRETRRERWLDCEKAMYEELMGEPFPGKDQLPVFRERTFHRRAVARCWDRVRKSARAVKPDCSIWLSCNDLDNPQVTGTRMLREVDWLMNERPDPTYLDDVRHMIGPHTRLIQCLCGWGPEHDAANVIHDPRYRAVGFYGFARPDPETTLPPTDTDDPKLAANAHNIEIMRQAFQSEKQIGTNDAEPASANVAAASTTRFRQDRFCISFWADPPADERMEERYQRVADANFNVVLAHNVKTPERAARLFDICRKHDLRAIIPRHGFPTEELPADEMCWGYYLVDEPGVDAFERWGRKVEEIRAARPDKLAYINLLPSHATPEHYGVQTYREYINRFIDEVDIDVLCFDRYPVMNPGADERAGYLENLGIIREHALEKGIPFWNFFTLIGYDRHYDPTEAQLRWQIYTSLAFGAKGVLYFTYRTPGRQFRSAIIDKYDQPTRHHDHARRINRRLKKLGPTLMKLTSTGVYRVSPGTGQTLVPPHRLGGVGVFLHEPEATRQHSDCPIRRISVGDYLIGVFRHEDGRRAVLLNNYRFAYTAWPTVEFDVPPDLIREVDQRTGQEVPFRDDSPDHDGLQISLDSGEGRLFLLPGT